MATPARRVAVGLLLAVIAPLSAPLLPGAGSAAAQTPSDGDLRLQGLDSATKGRLEIYYNDEWGGVCDDGFGAEEVAVAVRQLGFADGAVVPRPIGLSTPTGLKIWLDDVNCTGSESRLDACSSSPIGVSNCYVFENVVLTVGETAPSSTALRLLRAEPRDSQLVLFWHAPLDQNGQAITDANYEYRHKADGGSFSSWAALTARHVRNDEMTATVGDLSNGTSYTVEVRAVRNQVPGETASVTATPTPNLLLNPPSLSVADAEATEGDDATLDFVVMLDPAPAESVTVDYATADGTATAGNDYTATSGTLTFGPGETTKTIAVPITDDTVEDDGETVLLTLSNATLAVLGDAEATGTIRNMEDEPETSELSVADAEATEEEDDALDFTVTLDPAATTTVTVDYATADGTATAGDDYTGTNGMLTFAPGDTTKTVSVPITDDTVDDAGETLTLTLSNASGADLGEAVATGTIRNTEAPQPDPLAAGFEDMPATHDGETRFDFRLVFNTEPRVSYRTLRDDAFNVTNGDLKRAKRETSGSNLTWTITVEPAGDDDITIELPATSDCDDTRAICTDDGGMLSNSPSATVVGPPEDPVVTNTPATGAPTISGKAQVDETLTASISGISDDNGLDNASFAYQWIRGNADIQGGTNSSYTLVNADESERIKVRVSFTDDADNAESVTSAATDPVAAAPNTAATGAPTISGKARVDETLTASVSGISDDDGLDNASFAYQWIRGATDIQGAADSSYTLVGADEGKTVKVRVSFTDDADNAESLTSAATDAVAPAPKPLTATFTEVPSEHAGAGTTFTFGLTFSEEFGLSYKTLRDDALEATGGSVRRSKRKQQGSNLSWTIHVEPSSHGPVTVRLPAGSVETDDGRALSNSPSVTVAGPVGISVGDARVEEAEGAVLAFAVTLSRAASGAVSVDYATTDGSAQAAADYTAKSGTLTFQAGESSQTIEVAVLDDSHDEGEETLTLTLSNISGGRLTDGEATGTIENHDPLPRALLARFGRTAAVHVVEHVEERIKAPREPGFRGQFAGRELRRGMEGELALSFLSQLGGSAGANGYGVGGHDPMGISPAGSAGPLGSPGLAGGGFGMAAAGGPMGRMSGPAGPMGAAAGPHGGPFGGGLLSMGLGGGDLLTGSAFAVNRETRQGGILSFWSRGARSHFSGRDGALSLGGDVRTTMFGADYAKGPVVAGLSLSHSRGLGEYAGVAGGQVASAVTGLYPWLGYKATDRITVWGVAGYGAGGMLLTPDGGPALESGLSMAMAAAGTRGELVAGGASGFDLAFKADALWVGTSIDGVDGPAGRLKATETAVTRFRTGLEGSRDYTLAGRLSLRPSVEVGLRQDGGDAETGVGMDVGGGLVVSDSSTGLSVDLRVRMLVMHQAEGFRERGMAVSLSYNPTPSTPLGFMARVAPSWGGQATSGAEALWGRESMAGMAHGSFAQGNRLDGEVGYGLPVGSRFVGTPRVGFSTSDYGRDYRVGYGLDVLDRGNVNFELGVDAHRRESPILAGADNGFFGLATLGW